MNNTANDAHWCENIILADADYADKVAFNLTVNFERMIGRRIPKADLARWAECIALDGGLREGEHATHLILLHDKRHEEMENFAPGNYTNDIVGKAFRGALGEFTMTAISNEELITKEELFCQTLEFLVSQQEVRRLMVIPDEQNIQPTLSLLRKADPTDKFVTLFAMQPIAGGPCRTEILGYSLMSALGIKGEEIK